MIDKALPPINSPRYPPMSPATYHSLNSKHCVPDSHHLC